MWPNGHSSTPGSSGSSEGDAKLGCGLLTGGTRILEGREFPVDDECDDWLDSWLAALDRHQPSHPDGTPRPLDLAMIQLGAWEIVDHRTDGDFRSLMDPARAAEQKAALLEAVDALSRRATTVVLIAHPDVGEGRLDAVPAGADYPEYAPERAQRWREIVREVAAERPDTVVVDMDAWISRQDDDLRLRPDGVHFSIDSAIEVAEWLVPELLRHADPASPSL